MSEKILVTSCKGGIGKSTVAANLSMALAMSGLTVLAVDCDFRMSCLDLIMGLENSTVFNFNDVIMGRCTLERAVVRDTRVSSLYFLSAPTDRQAKPDAKGFFELIKNAETLDFDGKRLDYIIIDAPAADDESIALSAPVSDTAITVCSHMPSAIRAAVFTSDMLDKYEIGTKRLVINSFDVKSALMSNRAGIIEMIDGSKTKLIGIVPFDRKLMLMQENGELMDKLPKTNNARKAFLNLSKRICGKQVPLFEGFSGKEYKKILSAAVSRTE